MSEKKSGIEPSKGTKFGVATQTIPGTRTVKQGSNLPTFQNPPPPPPKKTK